MSRAPRQRWVDRAVIIDVIGHRDGPIKKKLKRRDTIKYDGKRNAFLMRYSRRLRPLFKAQKRFSWLMSMIQSAERAYRGAVIGSQLTIKKLMPDGTYKTLANISDLRVIDE